MAVTSYPVGHPNVRKHWSADVFKEALKRTYALKFMGNDSNSLIQLRNEMQKGKGDYVRFFLRMQLTGAGISGDSTLEGNEEALSTYYDGVLIDQLRHAVRVGGRMSEQRVPYEIRAEARDGLSDWFADRIDTAFFNQIAGNYEQTDTRYTGSNSCLTASGSGNVWMYGHSTTASLTASATGFGLSAIDACVELAQTREVPIRPVRVGGQDYYVMFIHPKVFTILKGTVSTTAVTWYDIQRAAMEGGKLGDNPIFTGAAGLYNNTLIHVAPRLPVGIGPDCSAGLSLYSSVFCGAQAAVAAFGRDNGPNTFNWVEEYFDYENQLGVASGTLWGLKKTQFNSGGTSSRDFATIKVLSSHKSGLDLGG
jgi:N4-gp56 family major capsid protein